LDRFFGTLEKALTLYKKEAKTDMRLARLISHNKAKRPSNGKAVQPPDPANPSAKLDAAALQPPAGPTPAPQQPVADAGACSGDPVEKLREEVRAQSLASDAALQLIAERVRELTCATGAVIALDKGEEVVCCASTGTAPAPGAVLQPGSGLSGQCMRSGEVVICRDSRRDPRVHPAVRATLDFRSALLAPITNQGKSAGLVGVFGAAPHTFDYLHAATLLLVGELVCQIAYQPAEPAASEVVSGDSPNQPETSADSCDSTPELDLLQLAMALVEGEETELPSPSAVSDPNVVEARC
jgi:hypothetical protein